MAAAQSDGDAAKSLIPVYYGGLAVGVLGLGIGSYLLLSSESAESSKTVRVNVGPGSISAQGTFLP